MEIDWWKSDEEAAMDIHNNLRQKEKDIPIFYGQSPQLASRRYLVDWLAIVAESYELCATARHLAISLMDYFMDKFDIEEQQLRIVALGCLLIACKFEEIETKIPKVGKLNEKYAAGSNYEPWQYLQMEISLLEFYSWNIAFPTAAHFSDFFLEVAVTHSDQHAERIIFEVEKTKSYMRKYVNYFLEISLQDEWYRSYRPSTICAACIASSRLCLNITPTWSTQLSKRTWYTWSDLQPIVQRMMKTHERDTEQVQPEEKEVRMTISPRADTSTGSTPPTPSTPYGIQDSNHNGVFVSNYSSIEQPMSFCMYTPLIEPN